jgi:hypothetical protein
MGEPYNLRLVQEFQRGKFRMGQSLDLPRVLRYAPNLDQAGTHS